MSWAVFFLDFDGRKRIKFTNWRSFNFTRAYNKAGNINIKLDASPTSKRIKAGFDIVIEKNSNRVYYGKIIELSEKEGLINIKGTDILGMLDKQTIFKRPTIVSEASVEVKRVLDGLQVAQGVELSADQFIEPTSTSKQWHWENNTILRYIKDIGEQVNNISGFTNNFVFWVDPYYNVWFGQTGTFGQITDIPITTITYSEDISQLYNKITVKGNPINAIPYDFDFWTEQLDAATWFGEPFGTSVIAANDFVDASSVHGYTGVSNPTYAVGNNGLYATIFGNNQELELNFNQSVNLNATAPSTVQTFNSATFKIDMDYFSPYSSSTNATCTIYFSENNGSSYCSGHNLTNPSGLKTITCSHGQQFTSSEFETSGSYGSTSGWDFVVKIVNTSPFEFIGDTLSTDAAIIKVDHAYWAVNYNYETGDYILNDHELTADFANFGRRSVSIRTTFGGTGYAKMTLGKTLYLEENASFNLENLSAIRFQYYIDTTDPNYSGVLSSNGVGAVIFSITDINDLQFDYRWTISNPNEAKDTWVTKDLQIADATTSGATDLTVARDIRIRFELAATGSSDGKIHLDNYYIVLDPFEDTLNDTTSQNKYGIREKVVMAREFFSNAECNAVGIILLSNLKDPVQKFNITAEGFMDIYPNSVFTFKYNDEEYNKPLVNITYYVNEDGSESMQLTVGDYKKDEIDVILDKFVEINRNADLLKNPYKIA